VEQVGEGAGGSPLSAEFVKYETFNVSRIVDPASPKIFRYCCAGDYINVVQIDVFSACGDDGPDKTPYLSIEMTYVMLHSYELKCDGGLPTETIGFKYGSIKYKVDPSGYKGSGGASTEQWSVMQQMPILFPAI
jgi:type VI protein secretion system component Hcp